MYIYILYIYIYICGISKSSKWDVQWDLNGIKMKKTDIDPHKWRI